MLWMPLSLRSYRVPYTLTVLTLLQTLSIIADHSGPISAPEVVMDSRYIYSGNIKMSIPKDYISPNSSRSDVKSCLIVCVWPSLTSTSEVRLGIPSHLTSGEFYMNILIQEKDDLSDPEKQFERYMSFNRELTHSSSVFGLKYMKSSSPTVRDIFTSGSSGDLIFARCEREDVRHPSCLLTMSIDGFVIQIGFPRSELWDWEEIKSKVGQQIRSWIRS
jgi:hypothetical protein